MWECFTLQSCLFTTNNCFFLLQKSRVILQFLIPRRSLARVSVRAHLIAVYLKLLQSYNICQLQVFIQFGDIKKPYKLRQKSMFVLFVCLRYDSWCLYLVIRTFWWRRRVARRGSAQTAGQLSQTQVGTWPRNCSKLTFCLGIILKKMH